MEFLTYKTLTDRSQVDAIADKLRENGIEFELSEDRESLDALYGGRSTGHAYFVKLKPSDFTRANEILERVDDVDLAGVADDHYLFAFTDEELFDILSKPDEWSALDYQLAKKILRDRGKEINGNVIDLLKKQRLAELAKPEPSSDAWIYAGYAFSIIGGLLGFFIAAALITSKKNLPDGKRIYAYSHEDRKHGYRMLLISVIVLFGITVVRMKTMS